MFNTPELLSLVDLMKETMRAAPGVGLAAPQIGVPLRARPSLPLQAADREPQGVCTGALGIVCSSWKQVP